MLKYRKVFDRSHSRRGVALTLVLVALVWPGANLARGASFLVSSASDAGAGSLRRAIQDANAEAGPDEIRFSIPGSGVKTIALVTALPAITGTLLIDGTTQPGFSGSPLIELNGNAAGAEADGLLIFADACVVRGLIINRFGRDGVHIQNGVSSVVEGNYLGTDATGQQALGNGEGGVTIADSFGNTIGGTVISQRNIIAGNRVGIFIVGAGSVGNRVQGNFIGVNATGATARGNTNGGVVVLSCFANEIGGTAPGAGNVIAGNGSHGVIIQGPNAGDNVVQGNLIGTDVTGRLDRGNTVNGVLIDGAIRTLIGGEDAGARNVISGNKSRGIVLRGSGASGTRIKGNFIGTDVTGTNRLGNSFTGISISSIPSNVIGGLTASARNVISGNGQSGITIEGTLASSNLIQGNFIGVDATGRRALSNGFSGVIIAGAPLNRIGGERPGAGNVISGNGQNGVHLDDIRGSRNLVQGNRIGTDVTGLIALGNGLDGVRVESGNNTIGGTTSTAGNLISANRLNGVVLLEVDATNNLIAGNLIGTDVTGARALGNALGGVGISGAPRNRVGGTQPSAGNVISGNGDSGVFVLAGGTSTVIEGNRIGCDASGSVAVANRMGGVYLYGVARTFIGGGSARAGNIISGNKWGGISVGDPGANGTVIEGNFIGTRADGMSALGNEWHSIEILNSSLNNSIVGNRIAFAQTALYAGVRIRDGCTGNAMRGNAIFANNGLGIDLSDNGPAPNDGCDGDNGANGLQNYPVLTSAVGQFVTVIQGTLNSKANSPFVLDFYSSSAADSGGFGEGSVWLGAETVRTSGGCNSTFTVRLTNSFASGLIVAATATDASGNTSEFSRTVPIENSGSVDSDGDGIPDEYENAFGLDSTRNDAGLDLDGDRLTNLEEFFAGTQPNNSASGVRLTADSIGVNRISLGFMSVPGKIYAIETMDRLPGNWILRVGGLEGTGTTLFLNDVAPEESLFHRLRVDPSP